MRRSRWWTRDLFILFGGQWVSQLGNNLFDLALYWYVLGQTGKASSLGLVGVAVGIPAVLGLFAGVFVDRYDRRWLMILADAGRAAVAGALALLAAAGLLSVWLAVALVMLLTMVGQLFSPAFTALLPSLAAPDDLPAVNGAAAATSSLAGLLGTFGGGIALAALGPVLLFGLNAVSFAVSVASLLLVRLPGSGRPPPTPGGGDYLAELRAGVGIVFGQRFARTMIGGAVATNFALQAFNVLAAYWIRHVLHGSAFAFGLYGGAVTVGALAGGLAVARLPRDVSPLRLVGLLIAVVGAAMAAIGLFPSLAVSFAGMFVMGGAAQLATTKVFIELQRRVDPSLHGRVFGAFGSLAAASNPVGAAVFGGLSGLFPVGAIFVGAGAWVAAAGGSLARAARGAELPDTQTPAPVAGVS